MTEECYYCNRLGTTDEHVPPRCLFPEEKDFGIDYRKNLITVRSCDEHNSKKSGSDENLRQILVASPFNNAIGLGLVSGKWARAFKRNAKYLAQFTAGGKPISYQLTESSKFQEGLMVKANLDDLDESLRKICAALFYYETGTKLIGNTALFTGFTAYLSEAIQRESEHAIETIRNYFSETPRKGENPEVFYYHFECSEGTAIFYLVFYEYNEVVVRFNRIENF
jgi:hypothetical protein